MAVTSDPGKIGTRVNAGPYTRAFAITEHAANYISHPDDEDRPIATRAILLDIDDTVELILANDTTSVTLDLTGGVVYPFSVKAVRAIAGAGELTGFI